MSRQLRKALSGLLPSHPMVGMHSQRQSRSTEKQIKNAKHPFELRSFFEPILTLFSYFLRSIFWKTYTASHGKIIPIWASTQTFADLYYLISSCIVSIHFQFYLSHFSNFAKSFPSELPTKHYTNIFVVIYYLVSSCIVSIHFQFYFEPFLKTL